MPSPQETWESADLNKFLTRPLALTPSYQSARPYSIGRAVYPVVRRPILFRSRLHRMIARSTTRRLGTLLDLSFHPHRNLLAREYPAVRRPTLFRPRPHRMIARSTTRHLGTLLDLDSQSVLKLLR